MLLQQELKKKKNNRFIFWLHWVFIAAQVFFSGCSEQATTVLLLLWSTGSRVRRLQWLWLVD